MNRALRIEEEPNTEPPPPMDTAEPQNDDNVLQPQQTTAKPKVSLRIWPPTQRTRDAVITRLIENLSQPSVLSKRFSTIPSDEAETAARSIEEEAFTVAGEAEDDDGIEILQVYSKEISKRMLDAMKARAKETAIEEVPSSVVVKTEA